MTVTLEYAKNTLAAPAQKNTTVQYKTSARSMLWQLQRSCSSSVILCFLPLFGCDVKLIINLKKRNSCLRHVLAQMHLRVHRVLCRIPCTC